MNQKLVLAAVVAVICLSVTETAARTQELSLRHKRSFSWMPTFLGGGSPATPSAADEPAEPVEETDEILNQADSTNVSPYPDFASIIGQGQVVNNQVYYPIWRVHKYNGLHLQPLPISLVQGGVPVGTEEVSAPQSSNAENTWLTPELVRMARELGVSDFSNLPSLQEAMDTLGTTTKEETIDIIKDFAGTEDGRALIRQFVGGTQDNDVAASETVEAVDNADNTEYAVEDTSNDADSEYVKSGDEDINAETQTYAIINNVGATGENGENIDMEGAGTILFGQYLDPAIQNQLLSQVQTINENAPQTTGQSEADDAVQTKTTTPANLFGRITQWATFLNPLTGRQVVPIPETAVDTEDAVQSDDETDNQQTVAIPALPGLPTLPQIPGEHPIPSLPEVHIPSHFVGGVFPYVLPRGNGHYTRVQYPLSGFNPTPQFQIDPNYLQFARNQLAEQNVNANAAAQGAHVPISVTSTTGEQRPVQVYHRIATTVVQPTANSNQAAQPPSVPQVQQQQAVSFVQSQATPFFASRPIHVTESVHTDQEASIPNLQLPSNPAKSFHEAAQSPVTAPVATHVGQLPLVNSANYEVFRDAPRIVSSYGAPAPPFTYPTSRSPNAFQVSPQSSAAFIQQEYQLKQAASEIVEQKIKADTEIPAVFAIKSESTTEKETDELSVNKADEQVTPDVDRSNENVKAHADSVSEQPSTTESEPKSEAKAIEAKVDTEDKQQETPVVEKTTTERSMYHSLMPKLRTNNGDSKSRIQRPNEYPTGRVFRADPKAVEMLPHTLRRSVN